MNDDLKLETIYQTSSIAGLYHFTTEPVRDSYILLVGTRVNRATSKHDLKLAVHPTYMNDDPLKLIKLHFSASSTVVCIGGM